MSNKDITDTYRRLCLARELDPKHPLGENPTHVGCEVCAAERRLDWLLSQVKQSKVRI